MGAPKQKWTTEEEAALRAGVEKHGPGKWRTIQRDPEFARWLSGRSNIDLKDKWRNMSVSAGGQGSRDKARLQKPKATMVVQSPAGPSSSASPAPRQDATTVTDSSKNQQEAKSPLKYNTLILEALSTLQDPNGSDIGAICSFMEQRHELPPNIRRVVSSRLRRLVVQEKIEKGLNGYKLKGPSPAAKPPSPKQKDPIERSHPPQNASTARPDVVLTEAAMTAAYKIADAEAKSFLASEAVKESERIGRMAEEAETLLLIAKDIFDQCMRGEIVTMA